jgi:hypothetical protein
MRPVLKAASQAVRRPDLYPVTTVGVRISTALRTGLIPDLVVSNKKPVDDTFVAGRLELVAEAWSPTDTAGLRETKKAAYAAAGVPFFWAVDLAGGPTIAARRLVDGDYLAREVAEPGAVTTIETAPVPVRVDPADLLR